MYLLGNGVPLPPDIEIKLDKKFDNKIIRATINACVDGVSWIYSQNGNVTAFRATEFMPLQDERTSEIMAGIRFWQTDYNKPIYIELYEKDGVTEYYSDNKGENIRETTPKRPYVQTIKMDIISTISTPVINEVLPIFPIYANELKQTELTAPLKVCIDYHDEISSDLLDGITILEGLYGIVKGYGGQDAKQLMSEIHKLHALLEDSTEASVGLQTVEIPFQAKQLALEMLEKRMYQDWLLPDPQRNGRAITATEIKAEREDLDIKADMLEWGVSECIENVLALNNITEKLPSFKRRTMVNDSETISNISMQTAGQSWITPRMAIMIDPTIPENEKEEAVMGIELLKNAEAEARFGLNEPSIQSNGRDEK